MTFEGSWMSSSTYDVLECDRRPTSFGAATYVRIHRMDMAPMGFRELWEVFSKLYPGKWAVQSFPPANLLLDQANKYHLMVFDEAPHGLDIMKDAPKHSELVAEYRQVPE